jgi:hypothetical protein
MYEREDDMCQQRRYTFKTILRQLAPENMNRLMERARLANRLAKISRNRARSIAYDVKAEALTALSRHFPEKVRFKMDPYLPSFMVVFIVEAKFGLHTPIYKYINQKRGFMDIKGYDLR